ncbi:hypothetical protein P43SY_010477 [Pythium insidiosum]|uniref:Uncharacterized protein n=1 Tax=Pythium insidiosum TaxID=114742 RepID=A0AAD5LSU1_PYTIN|nr:hypothetical protein P43SY_010477 [Pythium insidiosum]
MRRPMPLEALEATPQVRPVRQARLQDLEMMLVALVLLPATPQYLVVWANPNPGEAKKEWVRSLNDISHFKRDLDAITAWKKTGSRFKTLKDFLNSKQGKQHKPP